MRRPPPARAAWLFLAAALAAPGLPASASPFSGRGFVTAREEAQGYRDGVVLAKPRPVAAPAIDQEERAEGLGLRARFERFGGVRVIVLPQGDSVPAAVARLMATGRYDYVEPDFVRHALATVPDDPDFGSQWGLSNNGSGGGIAGADISAEAGWDVLSQAPDVVVGMLDSGVLTTHEDLAPNLWINPNPGTTKSYSTVGSSGSVTETDSLYGLNGVAKTGLPTDDQGHGTLTSGVVGAVGNNSKGVAGVAWKVQLMELKFLGSSGSGSTTDELPCIDYAIEHGVSVVNGSFGSANGSQAEMDAIQSLGKAGIIFVCAAGNSSENIDISPEYPADYPLDNVISVGASDNRDLPAYFSNYGSGSVEIFAPGLGILTTSNSGTSGYDYASGTSLAAPFVTGAVALLRAKYPNDTYRETINRILNCADPVPALAGKAQTGGRLNLAKALTTAASTPPNDTFAGRTILAGADPYTRSNNADSPASNEAGTPTVAGAAGGHSLWWQWTAPQDASVEIDTSGTSGGAIVGGSTYPTLLGVYSGNGLGSLALVADSADYASEPLEGNTGTQVSYSEVKFHASAGTTYQVLVQGQGSQSGQTVLAINTDPDNDSASHPRVLTGASASVTDANPGATLESGEPRIQGNAGGHSLWYSWTAPRTGSEQVSGYSYDFNPEVAVYTGSSIGSLSLVASAASSGTAGTATPASSCMATFSAVKGTPYLICVDGKTKNDIGEFTLSVADSRWQVVTGDAVTCFPAVGPDGTVYVGGNDKAFYAINQSGSVAWSHAAGGTFDTCSAAVGPDGTVYEGCADGNVYAFGPAGSVKWKFAVPTSGAGLSSSPALAGDGTIYIHADDGNLYALTPAGALEWKAAVPGASYAAPTIAPDGTVYIGSDSGSLYAFTPAGAQKWKYTTPVAGEEIYTTAAIDAAGNLYFGTLSGNVYSVDASANLRWSFKQGTGVTSAPALAGGSVYFGGYDGSLYSLSASSGALNWKFAMGAQVRASAPAVDANGVVYVGCYDHNVYAVSAEGSLVRTYAADDFIRSSPVIAGTTLYFGSNDHKVYAFDLGVGPASADWPMYQYDGLRLGRAQVSALAITSQPASETVAPGSPVTLSVGATGPGPLSYQWYLNGGAIAGAVNSDFEIASATAADDGAYSVDVTSGSSTVVSAAATLTVAAPPPPPPGPGGRIVNLSARCSVGTGGDILIAGFVIQGTGTKTVLLRGIGPALGTFNVQGALAQPQLSLVSSAGATLASDASWGGTAALTAAFKQVGAFALQSGSADSAILTSLSPGAYTSELSGIGSTTGIGLAEIYDADTGTPTANLVNISARASVGSGANVLIAGFVVQGSQPVRLLLRGVGPTLGATPFNVSGAISQVTLGLYDSTSTLISSDTGWGNALSPGTSGSSATARLATAADMSGVGAFALTAGSADSAMVATVPSGSYTVQLAGAGGSTGVGLVEVYLMP